MKPRKPMLILGLGAAIGLLLVTLVAEVLGNYFSAEWRAPLYAGGMAGIAVGVLGLPFAWKLVALGRNPNAGFWKWWGAGFLFRMVLAMSFAFVLALVFRERAAVSLLALTGTYVTGMFGETVWVADQFVSRGPTRVRA